MKDRIIELLEKIPVIPIFLGVLIYYGWDVYEFHTAPDREVANFTRDIDGLQGSNDKLQGRVGELKKFQLELEQKRQDIRQLTTRLDEVKANLPEEFNIALFMQTVITEAKKAGLTPMAIRPQERTPKSDYMEHSFDFAFRGIYHQLLMFLKRLTQLQTIVRVESFVVRPTSRRVGSIPEVEGNIQIKGFSYMRTNADEISKTTGGAK